MTENKEKIQWVIPLVVPLAVKLEVLSLCRQRKVRIPDLVGALIESAFAIPGFVEGTLKNTQLPKSHQRSSVKVVNADVSLPSEPVSNPQDDSQDVQGPESASEAQPSVDPKRLIAEVLEKRQSELATVHPLRPKPSNVVPMLPKEARRTSWQELCEMMKLPGENLDSELDAIQSRWEERWGEPTEEELLQMGAAADVRREVYAQWRERYRELQALVQLAIEERTAIRKEGRALRLARVKARNAKRDLEAFKLRTRWDERSMSELHPWEVPAQS